MASTLHTLPHHEARRFAAPARVVAESGLLWITVDGEGEDILLPAGESREFTRAKPLVVYALGGDARFRVSVDRAERSWRAKAAAWSALLVSSFGGPASQGPRMPPLPR